MKYAPAVQIKAPGLVEITLFTKKKQHRRLKTRNGNNNNKNES